VHAGYDAMEDALLQTGIVKFDRIKAVYRRTVSNGGLDLLLLALLLHDVPELIRSMQLLLVSETAER
jgi:hypothetical protein